MIGVMIHAVCYLGLTTVLENGQTNTDADGGRSFGRMAIHHMARTCEKPPDPAHHSKWKAGRVTLLCKFEIDFLEPKWPTVYMGCYV